MASRFRCERTRRSKFRHEKGKHGRQSLDPNCESSKCVSAKPRCFACILNLLALNETSKKSLNALIDKHRGRKYTAT